MESPFQKNGGLQNLIVSGMSSLLEVFFLLAWRLRISATNGSPKWQKQDFQYLSFGCQSSSLNLQLLKFKECSEDQEFVFKMKI